MKIIKSAFSIMAILVMISCPLGALAQKKAAAFKQPPGSRKSMNDFLSKQWWVGPLGGINITTAVVDQQFHAYEPINYDVSTLDANYSRSKSPSGSAGIMLMYSSYPFTVSFQPNYRTIGFQYESRNNWRSSTDSTQTLSQLITNNQKLNQINLPILIKYEFGKGNLRPFVQAGGELNINLRSWRNVEIHQQDIAAGSTQTVLSNSFTVNNDDQFKKTDFGLLAGAGVFYDYQFLRLSLDISYRLLGSQLTNENNRFSDVNSAGVGHLTDQLSYRNLQLNFGILFPLKYVNSGLSRGN